MGQFDWAAILKAGVRGTGLPPDAIWKLSPAELLLLVGPEVGGKPLGRSGLDALLTHFPDEDGG